MLGRDCKCVHCEISEHTVFGPYSVAASGMGRGDEETQRLCPAWAHSRCLSPNMSCFFLLLSTCPILMWALAYLCFAHLCTSRLSFARDVEGLKVKITLKVYLDEYSKLRLAAVRIPGHLSKSTKQIYIDSGS